MRLLVTSSPRPRPPALSRRRRPLQARPPLSCPISPAILPSPRPMMRPPPLLADVASAAHPSRLLPSRPWLPPPWLERRQEPSSPLCSASRLCRRLTWPPFRVTAPRTSLGWVPVFASLGCCCECACCPRVPARWTAQALARLRRHLVTTTRLARLLLEPCTSPSLWYTQATSEQGELLLS